jgi:hypothetical protein
MSDPQTNNAGGAVFSSFDLPHLTLNLASELPCDKGKTGRKKGGKNGGVFEGATSGDTE